MRPEQCQVITDAQGKPLKVFWDDHEYALDSVKRTQSSHEHLSFREYWLLRSRDTVIKVYSIEYGSPGHQTEKWWWISGIAPNPRGMISLR